MRTSSIQLTIVLVLTLSSAFCHECGYQWARRLNKIEELPVEGFEADSRHLEEGFHSVKLHWDLKGLDRV